MTQQPIRIRIAIIIFSFLCSSLYISAQSWEQIPSFDTFLEDNGLEQHFYSEINFHNDEIHLLLQTKQDPATGNNPPVVIKYTGNQWEIVGTLLSAEDLYLYPRFTSFKGELYISFVSGSYQNEQLEVFKYDGTQWQEITPQTQIRPGLIRMEADDDYLYLGAIDRDGDSKITIHTYDGNNWSTLGDPYFSPPAFTFDFDINASGGAAVSYIDGIFAVETDGTGHVMNYDGSGWNQLGGTIAESSQLNYLSIAYSSDCLPYVVFDNQSINAVVSKYDGEKWVDLPTLDPTLTVDANLIVNECVPYLSYRETETFDGGYTSRTHTYKFVDNAWIQVDITPDNLNRSFTKFYKYDGYIYRYEYFDGANFIIERLKFSDDTSACNQVTACECALTKTEGCTEEQFVDIALTKVVNNTTPDVGEVVSFSITVRNDGPANATSISVRDLLPNGYANVSNISNGGAESGNTISWSGLNIGVGEEQTLSFDTEVLSQGDGVVYINTAEVTSVDQIDVDSDEDNDDGDQSEDDEDNARVIPRSTSNNCSIQDLNLDCATSSNQENIESWNQNNINDLTVCASVGCDPLAFFVVSDYDFSNYAVTCGSGGSLTVTYTIVNCDGSADVTATINVTDNTPPIITCIPDDLVLACASDNDMIALTDAWNADNISLLEGCSSDACSGITVTSDYTSGGITCGYNTTVSYTISDDCGNITTVNATAEYEDDDGDNDDGDNDDGDDDDNNDGDDDEGENNGCGMEISLGDPLVICEGEQITLDANVMNSGVCEIICSEQNGGTLVEWDMDACYSITNGIDNKDFSELAPKYPDADECVNIEATPVNVEGGMHSCTIPKEGLGGRAMCFSGSKKCYWQDDSPDALKFSVTLTPENSSTITGLQFYESAPKRFTWYNPDFSEDIDEGPNNFPRFYGLRVTKNGEEIYQQNDIPTTNDWTLEEFDFADNDAFKVHENTTFVFELLAYCPDWRNAITYAWDLDNIKLLGGCCDKDTTITAVDYQWSTGETTQSITATPTEDTDYSVTVTDCMGCVATKTLPVQVNTPITADLGDDINICLEDLPITLSHSVEGIETPSVEWSTGEVGESIQVSEAGTYTVTITDGVACSDTDEINVTITQPDPLNLPDDNTIDPICTGSTIDLSTLEPSSQSGGEWTNVNDEIVSSVSGGTYTYTYTDGNGCQVSDQVMITEDDFTFTIDDQGPICFDALFDFSTIVPEGVDGDNWKVTDLGDGNYRFTGTNANGCTASNEFKVSIDNFSVDLMEPPVLCEGEVYMLIDQVPEGYPDGVWTDMDGNVVDKATPGMFTYTVTNENGCTASDKITFESGGFVLMQLQDDSVCWGDSILLSTLELPEQSGGFWKDLNNNLVTYGYQDALYRYHLFDDVNECAGIVTIRIHEKHCHDACEEFTVSVNSPDAICSDETITLSTLEIDGANGGTWVSADGVEVTTGGVGSYTYAVTTMDGCTASVQVEIPSKDCVDPCDNYRISLSDPSAICDVDKIDLSTLVPSELSGGQWTNSSGEVVTTVGPGAYTYTLTSAEGCTASAIVNIQGEECSDPCDGFRITVMRPDPICMDESINVRILEPVSSPGGIWTDENGDEVDSVSVGNYTYTFTDLNGCIATDKITIEATNCMDPCEGYSVTITDPAAICEDDTIDLTILVPTEFSGGEWTNEAGDIVTVVNPGIYKYTLTSEDGCEASAEVTLTGKDCSDPCDDFTLSLTNPDPICSDATIDLDDLVPAEMGGGRWKNSNGQYLESTSFEWQRIADLPAPARAEGSSFSIGNYGYLVGGRLVPTIISDELWRYDHETNEWEPESSLPYGKSLSTHFSIGNKGYVMGGSTGAFQGVSTNLAEYDLDTKEWTEKADFPGDEFQFGATMVIDDQAFFIGGNMSDGLSESVWAYDQSNDEWIEKSNFPGTLRYGGVAFGINGKGYYGLGNKIRSFNNKELLSDMWEYDPQSDTWTQLSDFPGGVRFHCSSFVVNDKGYVGLGIDQSSRSKNDFYEYDPQTNEWQQIEDFPGASRSHAYSFVNTDLAVVGGGKVGGSSTHFNDYWAYRGEAITDVGAGDYTYSITTSEGCSASADVTITEDCSDSKGSISGSVLEDTNDDDLGDKPIMGVDIELIDIQGNVIATAMTDGSGMFQFMNVASGNYILKEIDLAGYEDVSDEDSSVDANDVDGADGIVDDMIPVTLISGESDSGNDFVNRKLEDNSDPCDDYVFSPLILGDTTICMKDAPFIYIASLECDEMISYVSGDAEIEKNGDTLFVFSSGRVGAIFTQGEDNIDENFFVVTIEDCSDPATPCDDGNPNTENDVMNDDCNCCGTPVSGQVIYVDAEAMGLNDGTSWTDAYTDLQDAMRTAQAGQEIWLADGIYLPTQDGDRDIYFSIPSGVDLYGGFNGGEMNICQRDFEDTRSVLSGDLLQDDKVDVVNTFPLELLFTGTEENSHYVLRNSEVTDDITIDGIAISGGVADESNTSGGGGFLFANETDATLEMNNVLVLNNQGAGLGGAGRINTRSATTFTVKMNRVVYLQNQVSGPELSKGGALFAGGFNDGLVDMEVTNCLFFQNLSQNRGGAICTDENVNSIYTNSLFVWNKAGEGGAIFENNGNYDAIHTNNTFYVNFATYDGGAIVNFDDFGNNTVESRNCIFSGNATGILENTSFSNFNNASNNFSFQNCLLSVISFSDISTIVPGLDDRGNNVNILDPLFVDPINGDFSLQAGSPAIDAGDDQFVTLTDDLLGKLRIQGDAVDIGANEFGDELTCNFDKFDFDLAYAPPTHEEVEFAIEEEVEFVEAVDVNVTTFPNPTTNELNVVVNKLKAEDEISLKLYDMAGGLIPIDHSVTANAGLTVEYKIPVNDFTGGVYFLKTKVGRFTINKRIIVIK